MKKSKKIILSVIIVCVVFRLLTSFSLNNSYPGGTDTSIHLLRVWLMQTKGILKWNYYSEGGQPILNIYPPLGYIIAGYLAKLFGFLISYKIVMDIVFLISIITYYIFLKEFKLDDKKIIVALLFFSFIPVHSYYLADGRYTSLISFIFSLLYWIYLKKCFDKNRISNLFISALFLSFAIMTNNTVAFMIIFITFIWSVLYQNTYKILKRFVNFILISLLAFLFSSWWLMPYVINRLNIEERSSEISSLLLKKPIITNYINEIILRVINLGVFQSNYIVITTLIYVIAIGFICLFSFFEIKNRTNRDFIIISLFIIFLSIILRFKRGFIFLPISLGIVISYGIFELQNKYRLIVSIILFVSIMVSFFLIKPIFIQNAYFPKLQNDGRFVYFGNESLHYGKDTTYNYFYLLSGIQENENIQGWYLGLNEDVGTSIYYSKNKIHYGNLLLRYYNMSQDEYYEILNEGWVNYVVLDKNSEFFDYFNKSKKFNFKHFDDEYSIFEIFPKSTYVEINNKSFSANVTKINDEIIIDMKCKPGNVTIKETYDKNWKGKLNGEDINLKENNYGFIKFENNLDGNCILNLKYELQKLDIIFLFISIVTYFFAFIYLIYDFMKKNSTKFQK